MIAKISAALLFLGVTIHLAVAEIDFTPEVKEYSAQGFIHRELTFRHDKGVVTFDAPQKWLVRGDKAQLQLSPPDKNFVEASIQSMPVPVPPSFDEASLRALEERVLREVPNGSQSVQMLRRLENPVAIGSYPSFEFVLSYQALGYTFHRSVLFVNYPDRQLVFRFTAPKVDFDTFQGQFRVSISSWNWINEPERPVGAGPMTSAK